MDKTFKTIRLPPATREAQIERWQLLPDGSTPDAGPHSPIRADLGAAGLLRGVQESADDGEGDGGWRTRFDDQAAEDARSQDARATKIGYLREGGWHAVNVKHGRMISGLTGHRGILHPDQYVDTEALRQEVERRLGATAAVVRDVYGGRRGGPLPARLRHVRDAIDAALTTVESVAALADVLGLPELAPALRRGRERGLRANCLAARTNNGTPVLAPVHGRRRTGAGVSSTGPTCTRAA
jgi:hypothetical protein